MINLIIDLVVQIIVLLIIAKIILSYITPPYHPAREALDRILEPFLMPIRRVIPPMGMFDFSPMVLLILVYLLANILKSIF